MAKRNRKRKPTELVSFTTRISVENREWIRDHADMIEMSQAAWFDGLLTSLRHAEQGLQSEGGLFDTYAQKIDGIVDRMVESRNSK